MGVVANGWAKKPLGKVCDILDRLRKPITKRDRIPGPYPYYGATGVLDQVADYIFDEPLVLIGEDGAKWEAGENSAFAIDGKTWVNNHAHVIRPHRDELRDDWLIYFLNASDLMPFVSGMTVPKLNQGRLKEIPIPIPSPEEQRRIVTVLDEVFQGLDRARAISQKNLADLKELYQSTLRRAFTGELTGDAEMSKWQNMRLIEIAVTKPNKKEARQQLSDDTLVSFVPMDCLNAGNRNLASHETRPLSAVYKSYTYFGEGDVLLAKITPCFENGKLGVARNLSNGIGFGSSEFFVIRSKGHVLADYIYYYFDQRSFRDSGKRVMTGAVGHKRVPRDFLETLSVPIPPLEDQQRIVGILDSIFEELSLSRAQVEANLANLADLRQSLLQCAFAGELT
ncbi:MAG: restriction endonuclease subunit S [Gemmatimonadetes bacterium]|nr:restriction endonuclease subunit S [Gemmatimonadota bacterium]